MSERRMGMREKEFNLLKEPWIKVMTPSLEQKEVSLTEAFIYAHKYVDLSGEMPTQDAALLRLLLAVAVTVFYRYDAYGEEMELSERNSSNVEDVLERWKEYWEIGRFPEQAVRNYLESYSERFWLFHPETPFWQVSNLQYGTDYDVKCLFGNIKESMNKTTKHHFSMIDGEELYHLSYGEAVRWLVHLNAYAINLKADKKSPGTQLPVGTGRLGELGFIMVNGRNLFQILMLNLCVLSNEGIWGTPNPTWEQSVCTEQGRKIGIPDNLPERYTIQSRRIMLKRDSNGNITGFRALGGDFYPVENDIGEPMTIWKEKKVDKKTGEELPQTPQTHNPAVHAWREFPTIFMAKNENKQKSSVPGVVQWINMLYRAKIISISSLITFRMIGMVYGDQMKYNYGDCVNDTLTISAKLLNDLNTVDRVWINNVSDQIDKCQLVANDALNHFAYKLCKLLYGNASSKNGIKDYLIRQYYFSIDVPFREWLIGINPSQTKREDIMLEWEKQSYRYAKRTVEDYIITRVTDIYTSRIDDAKGGKAQLLSIPKIVNEYLAELNRIYIQTKNTP